MADNPFDRILGPNPGSSKSSKGKSGRGGARLPFHNIGLIGTYGVSFTPGVANTETGAGERDALNQLYGHRTGFDLSSHPDPATALRDSGLLHPIVSSRGAATAGRSRLGDRTYASAADAIDAVVSGNNPVDRKIKEGLRWYKRRVLENNPELGDQAGVVRNPVGEFLSSSDPLRWYRTRVEAKNPELKNDYGGTPVDFGGIVGDLFRPMPEAKRPTVTTRAEKPSSFYAGRTLTSAQAKKRPWGTVKSVGDLPADFGITFANPLTEQEIQNLKEQGYYVGGTYLGGLIQTVYMPGRKLKDNAVTTDPARDYINSSQMASIALAAQNLINSQKTADGAAAMEAFLKGALENLPASDLNQIQETTKLGPLTRSDRQQLLELARANGWEIANPRAYTDADLARRAFQRSDGEWFWTGLYRGVGGLSSLPAFLAAAIEAGGDAAQGDPDPAKQLIKQAVAPFTYLVEDANRRGWKAASESFVKERPFDAINLVNGAIRTAGRGAAIGMRTVGGTGRTAPQAFISGRLGVPAADSFLGRMGEYARVGRPVTFQLPGPKVQEVVSAGEVPAVLSREGENVAIPVGTTGKNVLDTVALGVKAWLTRKGLESGFGIAERTAGHIANRAIRNIATKRDVARVEATNGLVEIARPLNAAQRERLGMELIRSLTDFEGAGLSLADAVAFWRRQADEALQRSNEAVDIAKRQEERTNSQRFSDTADMYQKLADTPLDQSVIDAARRVAEPIGKRNDMYIGAVIDALFGEGDARGIRVIETITDASGASRRRVASDLRAGDYIDPSSFARKGRLGEGFRPSNPAVVTGVRLSERGVEVSWESVMDPTMKRTVTLKSVDRPVRVLSSGAVSARYVRDFIMLDEQIKAMARSLIRDRRVGAREATIEANAPIRRLMKLDAERRKIGEAIILIAQKMEAARAEGSLSKTRRYARQYAIRAYALRGKLVEIEREARAQNFPELADWARARIDEIKIERGDLGGSVEGAAAARQAGVLRAVQEGQVAPVVSRFVEQPRAAELLGRAASLEARAAELRRLEQQLVAERDAAPNASAAAAATRRIEELRGEIDSLVRMSGEARRSPSGFVSALDNLEARYDYLRKHPFVGSLPSGSKWIDKFNEARADLLRTLGDLRQKVDNGAQITKADVAALRRVESDLVSLERRARSTKAYRESKVGGEPANFGSRAASQAIDLKVPERLVGEAFGAAAKMTPLEERLADRAAAPPMQAIRDVRRSYRQAVKLAAQQRREAARIIERGQPLVSDKNLRVMIDASTGEIAVDLKGMLAQPVRFKIGQVRNELRNEYIARAEMVGSSPVLWLGTRRGTFGAVSTGERTRKQIDLAPGAELAPGRLEPNRGVIYSQGMESFQNLWSRLISDTGAIAGNAAWVSEMRNFLEGISVRVSDMTEQEAAAYNAVRGGYVQRISGSEAVVFSARDWVAIPADRRFSIRNVVSTGTADLTEAQKEAQRVSVNEITNGATTLADLFERVATIEDVAKAGGNYYLVPRVLYNQITKELREIEYTPTSKTFLKIDSLTKTWRTFTLNVLPRTAFANLVGSCVLAAVGGAGPRSFYMAYRHLKYGDIPAPVQLRQGFGATLTKDIEFTRTRAFIASRAPGAKLSVGSRELSLETPFAGLAYWMNMMRRFNGITEDFGRLAVWYSKAYPEAAALAGESAWTMWTRGRDLSVEAQDVLESLARGDDPNTSALAQSFVDHSFEWLGDLHAGGEFNTRLRLLIPFQQWYRHIVRLTLITMPLKYPGRALMLQRMGDIGREYLQKHGIFPPWMMDVIPILVDEKMIDGIPQEYLLAWHAGNANPFGTPAGAVSGEQQQIVDWAAGMLNPLIRSFAEVIMSAISRKALRMGGDYGFEAVKNQANNNISLFSSDGGAWFMNEVQRTLPLSSLAVTSSGQAAEGNILFGGAPKLLRGAEGFLPAYASPPDAPGRDIAQLVTNFSFWNAAALTARTMFGGSAAYAIGRGPVEDTQFVAYLGRLRRNFIREMNNIEKSQYQLEQTTPPSQVVTEPATSAPPADQQTTAPSAFSGNALELFQQP